MGGVLTWGRFDVHTQIDGRTEVHRCGEFDFVTSGFNKKSRMSELAPFGNLGSGSEEKITIRPFIFGSKLAFMEDYLVKRRSPSLRW